MSSWVPAQHPLNPALIAWAADITKASNGTITATLFPSEQLGKAVDHYDMAKDGIADFAYVNPGYQPGRFPVIAGAGLPFIFANGKGGSAAIDAWYRAYAAKEMKDVKFCFAFIHDPGTFHGKKKLLAAGRRQGHEGAAGDEHDRPDGRRCSAAPTSRRRRRKRATCSSAASPTRSPSRGARSACSASTRW